MPYGLLITLSLIHFSVRGLNSFDSQEESNDCLNFQECFTAQIEVSENCVVRCRNFNENISALLPATTVSLSIYQVYNLPVNKPLASHLKYLDELRLNGNKLVTLENAMLKGFANIQILDLSDNFIKRLSLDIFIYNERLKEINLSKNFILSVRSVTKALSGLFNLKTLDLHNNVLIRWLTNADFDPFFNTSLKEIDLSNCQVSRIDEDTFRPLKNLSSLILSINPLNKMSIINMTKSLPLDTLKEIKISNIRNRDLWYIPLEFFQTVSMSSIEHMDLSYNRFFSFPSEIYSFPFLKTLNLMSCELWDIPNNAFRNMPNLETLILKRNIFLTIDTQLSSLHNLKFLDLSEYMKVVKFEEFTVVDFAFRNLSNLETLYMMSLPIQNPIRRYTFNGLSKLQKLRVCLTLIKSIEDFSFESLYNLEILDLSRNFIETLTNNTFYGLRKVRTIALNHNALTILDSSYFIQRTPLLENLHLKNNKIRIIPAGVFINLTKIGFIQLSNNALLPWYQPVLPRNENITVLLIDKNSLSYFTPAMLDDFIQLEFLDFSENPLNCSACGVDHLHAWLKNTTTEIVKINKPGLYNCETPPSLEGQSILYAEFSLDHCLPFKINVLLVICSVISTLIGFILVLSLIWYKCRWYIRYYWFHIKVEVKNYRTEVIVDQYKYDCFVSYCDTNVEWVHNHLVEELENKEPRYKLCLTDRDFDAKQYITSNVLSAIQESRTTMLVISNEYLKSVWCKFEMDMAQHKLFEETRNSLILVVLEDIEKALMTKNLKYVIQTRTCILWTTSSVGQKLFWDRLRLSLSRVEDKSVMRHIT